MLVFLTHPDGHRSLANAKTPQGAASLVARETRDPKWNQSVLRIPAENTNDVVYWIEPYPSPEPTKKPRNKAVKEAKKTKETTKKIEFEENVE